MNARRLFAPVIVAAWDGNHVWLQWESGDPKTETAARARYAKPGGEFGRWIEIGLVAGRDWTRFPTNKSGWRIQCQAREGAGEWVDAAGAVFKKSRCRFEISSGRKVTFRAGETLHGTAGGEPSAYCFIGDVHVQAGEPLVCEMEALQSSGLNQLDAAGEFEVRPAHDMVIRNIEPSRGDIEMRPGEEAIIMPVTPDGPLHMAFGRILR